MSANRKIIVDGVEWRWSIGPGGHLTVRHVLTNKRFQESGFRVKGTDPWSFEKDIYKRSSSMGITPKDVEVFIRSLPIKPPISGAAPPVKSMQKYDGLTR